MNQNPEEIVGQKETFILFDFMSQAIERVKKG